MTIQKSAVLDSVRDPATRAAMDQHWDLLLHEVSLDALLHMVTVRLTLASEGGRPGDLMLAAGWFKAMTDFLPGAILTSLLTKERHEPSA